MDAAQHDIYFSTDYGSVKTAHIGDDPNGAYIGRTDSNSYIISNGGDLKYGTTYYWRIDEVNGSDVYTGTVWRFITKYLIVDPNMLLWYPYDEMEGEWVYDHSGYGFHSSNGSVSDGWDPDGRFDGCLEFDDDIGLKVDRTLFNNIDKQITIAVWLKDAYRDGSDNWVFGAIGIGSALEAAVVEDDTQQVLWRAGDDTNDVLRWNLGGADARKLQDWHHWAFVKDESAGEISIYFDGFLQKSSSIVDDTLINISGQLQIGAARGHDNDLIGKMDDFRLYNRALTANEIAALYRGGDLTLAWAPQPHNGDMEARYDADLVWKPGDHASSHDVYFGTNWDDVNDANNNWPVGTSVYKGNQEPNTYALGILDLGQTYYWRIDEVNDSNSDTWKGKVWRFKIADYIIIDDFEDDTLNSAGNWLDGYYNYQTGSMLSVVATGYPYRGTQSVDYSYDNSWGGDLGNYSEVETKSLKPTNWEASGVKMLTLWFYGDP